MTDDRVIEYRYLNMDTEQFVKDAEELIRQVPKGYQIAIPNYKYNQVLVAAGSKGFTKFEAMRLSRQISGVKCNG